MAILILSLVVAVVLGCVIWLLIGDRFPLKAEMKFPAHNNIAIYAILLIIPVYLVVFITF
ncbi:MAG: hypothetical protein JKY88_19185 [Pseudomonadales bacterium]|nr:hypothetical protein [Pseudomonadales bacterium]